VVVVAGAALVLLCGGAFAVPGRVESVTVYRSQAEVIRVVPVAAGKGVMEVVVSDLPERIVPDSLYANGDEGLLIRGVAYRVRAVGQAPREEVRKLDQQIEAVEKLLRENQQAQETVKKKLAYMDKLEGFSAPTVDVELKKGVLDADMLRKLTLFVFEQRDALGKLSVDLQEQARTLNEQLSVLRRERANLTEGVSKTAREAVLFVEKQRDGAADVRLGYLVTSVQWTPGYNLRAATGKAEVEVEYNASVQQMSGEDWNDITLTLSTASPTLACDAPALAPFWVTLGPPGVGAAVRPDVPQLMKQQRAAEEQYRVSRDEQRARAEAASNYAGGQVVLFQQDQAKWLDIGARTADAAVAVNYPLSGKHSLKSRSDRQAIRITSLKLPAQMYSLAVPILTRYVYKHAEVTNKSDTVLLEGRVNAYLDGQFAGTGTVPLARPGQHFIAGFGVDTRLAARQTLVDRQERIVGGNKEQTFTYQVLLENFSDKPVAVRVLDRFPAVKDAGIRISLVEPLAVLLSKDALYERFQKPHNILRWDVEVPADATEANPHTLEYKIKIEFDKNLQIVPVSEETYQRELERNVDAMMRGAH
jgi:uncharacterized protein (TIGR02231 family)